MPRHRPPPFPPRPTTFEQLCADFRCTAREILELKVRLHMFRAEKAMRELARHDALSMLRGEGDAQGA